MYAKMQDGKLIFPEPNKNDNILNYCGDTELLEADGWENIPDEQIAIYNRGLGYKILENPLRIEDISETDEYKAEIAEAERTKLLKEFIPTSIGYLKTQTAVGDLLSIFNTYAIEVMRKDVFPAGKLLVYKEDKTSAWNEEMDADTFFNLYDEVKNGYMARFRNN